MSRLYRFLSCLAILFLCVITAACQVATHPDNRSPAASSPSADQAELPAERMLVHFIDVGQGDAILVQTPDGQNLLVDGGPVEAGSRVLSYLKGLGVKDIDIVVATHPHSDHIGGLVQVLNNLPVKKIYMPRITNTTDSFENLLSGIKKQNLTIDIARKGVNLPLTSVQAQILWPGEGQQENLNNYSVVLHLRYGQTSFLLTGDAEHEVEQSLLASGANLKADVLKVAHHGSSSASSLAFLQAVHPRLAVIMCGAGNDYGHPHAVTLKNLAQVGADIYRTDLQGTIVLSSDGRQVAVFKVEKPEGGQNANNSAAGENDEPYYIGNSNSRVFHWASCKNLPAPENQVLLQTREQALEEGYHPCAKCRP